MPQPVHPLVRAIGRWSLAGLALNSIIGSGIFGLPSLVVGLVGRASPLAVMIAGVAIAVILACYAEVASQFTVTGGTYLYVREAFGRFAGIQVGWFLLLVRLTASAATANLFVIYGGEFWPRAANPIPRFLILTLLVGTLAAANYRGVRAGAEVSNGFVLAKLLPLSLICLAGAIYLAAHHRAVVAASSPAGARAWLEAMLLLTFSYGGAESALIPAGEAKDPRRDAAFALFVALGIVTLIYTVIQWVVVGVLPDAAHSVRPLADVAGMLMGKGGTAVVAIGALLAVLGYLSANMLTLPRSTFALAEQGDFPSWFATIHRKFRTPHVSILVIAILIWLLALLGSFSWNVTLSAAARLLYYGLVCAAVPVLRKKQSGAASFPIPGGPAFAVVGVVICLVLFAGVDLSKFLILAVTFSIALLNWLVVRRTTQAFSLPR